MDKWNLITHRWKFGSQNTSIKAWRVVCVHNEISRKLLQINEFPAAKACVKLLPKENELKFCWCWNLLTLWSICPYLWQNLDSLRIHPVKIQLMSTVFMTVRWVIWWHLWWPLKVSITCCVHQLTITNVLLILRSSSLCLPTVPLLLHCAMLCPHISQDYTVSDLITGHLTGTKPSDYLSHLPWPPTGSQEAIRG